MKKPIRGRILTHEGKPVSGAKVRLYKRVLNTAVASRGRYSNSPVGDVFTDHQGKYEFRDVDPAWAYQVTAITETLPAGKLMIPDDGVLFRDQSFDIVLRGLISINGVVSDETGQPMAEVRVISSDEDKAGYADTNEQGFFSLDFPADSQKYSVRVYQEGKVDTLASITPAELNGAPWILRVNRLESLMVAGNAAFVDGPPIANTNLQIEVEPLAETKRTHRKCIHVKTDSQGNFAFALPQPVRYTGVAKVIERGEYGTERQWWCEIQSIAPGQSLDLQFNNRGKIFVDFEPTILPKVRLFSISCYQVKSYRTTRNLTPPTENALLTFSGLDPGEYIIRLGLHKLTNETWFVEVTIPNEAPYSARVNLRAPIFRTGDIKALIVMPDGRTPARGASFYLEGAGTGRSATTDSDGRLLVNEILQGSPSISSSGTGQIASGLICAIEVVAGRETDLGTIRLKSADEEFGWLEGTATYVDHVPLPVTLSELGSVDRSVRIEGDGKFRCRFHKETTSVAFTIRDNAISEARFLARVPEFETQLIVPVEIVPGETVVKNVVLNPGSFRKPIAIVCADEKLTDIILEAIVDQDDFRWVQTIKIREQPTTTEVTQLPASGDCIVIARANNYRYFFLKRVPIDSRDQLVRLDIGETGSIAISVVGEDGTRRQDFGAWITMEIGGMVEYVCYLPPVAEEKPNQWSSTRDMFQRRDDGVMIISGIGPGVYSLEVADSNWKHQQPTTVVCGEETIVRVVLR